MRGSRGIDRQVTSESLKHVLLIHTDGNTFNNPTLKCIVDLLLERGVQITIRYPTTRAPMPATPGVRFLGYGQLYRRFKSIVFDRLCSLRLARLLVFLESTIIYREFDLIIGVDRQGLIEAGILNRLKGVPFVFFSFEIMFESETSSRYKTLERIFGRRARCWLVQDEERAALLEEENGLDSHRKVLLPLASKGLGTKSQRRLRDTLGIPAEKRVAMLMGSISSWSMASEVILSSEFWPEPWVLVVHERYGNTKEAMQAMNIPENVIQSDRIFLSQDAPDHTDDMGSVLAGVDAGLAFYRPEYRSAYTGKNIEHIGLASGKISTFLRYGVPVVMNDIGQYAHLARTQGFGDVVDDPAGIGDALANLDCDNASQKALITFSERFDFQNQEEEIWGLLLEGGRHNAAGD